MNTDFRTIALFWHNLGFRVIPGKPSDKVPYVAWKKYQTESVSIRDINDWADLWPDAVPLLLTGVSDHEDLALYVIDVDDMELYPWVQHFVGDSPFAVSTGRKGGGRHLYFQGEPGLINNKHGQIGPEGSFEKKGNGVLMSKIDIKGFGGYVVAPGALHKSGRRYLPLGLDMENVSLDYLLGLPYFPEVEVEESLELYFEMKKSVGMKEGSWRAGVSTWSDETSVVLADRSTLLLREAGSLVPDGGYVTCFCPFHDNENTPSAAVYNRGGKVSVFCFAENKAYFPSKGLYEATLAQGTSEGVSVLRIDSRGLSGDSRVWCPALDGMEGVLVNTFPTGHGKTTQAARLAAGFDQVIAVGPTTALTGKLAEDFGLDSYEDVDGTLVEDRIAVCLPSLQRVALQRGGVARGGHLLIIDEGDQIFDLLHQESIMVDSNGNRITTQVWEHLSYLMRSAKTVLINDAFASKRLLREVARMTDNAPVTLISPPTDYKPLQGFVEHSLFSKGALLGKVLEAVEAGSKGTIACDTKKDVEAFTLILNEKVGADKVLSIHSKSSPETKKMLRDATSEASKYDWIVFNQAAGSGVSFEMPGYKSFVCGTCHPGSNGAQLRQLSARLRYPENDERYSFVAPVAYDLDVDFGRIASYTKSWAEKELGAVRYFNKNGKLEVHLKDETVIESKADSSWYQAVTSSETRSWYYESLEKQGAVINHHQKEDTSFFDGLLAAATQDVSEAAVEAVRAALAMTREEALEVTSRSPQEAQEAARRHWLLERWGAQGTDERLLDDTADKLWNACKLFVDTRLVALGLDETVVGRIAAKAYDKETKTMISSHLNGDYARARVMHKLLRAAGMTDDMISTLSGLEGFRFDFAVCNDDVLKEVTRVDQEYGILQMFGTTPPDSSDKLAAFYSRLLKKIGLETKRTKVTVEDRRVDMRVIDSVHLSWWKDVTQRRFDKMTNKDVEKVEDFDMNDKYEAPKVDVSLLLSKDIKPKKVIKEKTVCPF